MIKLEINRMLGERTYHWLSVASKVEYSVILNLASQKSQRIKYSTLERLCDALNCQPGDLIARMPGRARLRVIS